MSPEMCKAIQSKGGKAAQAKGTGHRWTAEEAKKQGSKGGQASQASGRGNQFTSKTGRKAGRMPKKPKAK
jgi:hypothetical protein